MAKLTVQGNEEVLVFSIKDAKSTWGKDET